jgi:hypothetical protein
LAASSPNWLPLRPSWPGTQQNTTNFPDLRSLDTWITILIMMGWSGEQLFRLSKALNWVCAEEIILPSLMSDEWKSSEYNISTRQWI